MASSFEFSNMVLICLNKWSKEEKKKRKFYAFDNDEMLSTYNGHYRLGKNFAHLLKKDTIIHKSYGSTNDRRPDDKFKVGWWLLIFVLILSFICMSHVVFVQIYVSYIADWLKLFEFALLIIIMSSNKNLSHPKMFYNVYSDTPCYLFTQFFLI
mgnify:CR=1 FL=1